MKTTRQPYTKAVMKKTGNLKEITFTAPSWQVSCETENHGPHGDGHGYGHVKAVGRGHHK